MMIFDSIESRLRFSMCIKARIMVEEWHERKKADDFVEIFKIFFEYIQRVFRWNKEEILNGECLMMGFFREKSSQLI